jgi:predicted site-specific integrase-resolvase
MSNAGRITLETWLAQTYAVGDAPAIDTVRRWARNDKLEPPAMKEGRSYYVEPGTRYTAQRAPEKPLRLVDRVRAAETQSREEHRPAR